MKCIIGSHIVGRYTNTKVFQNEGKQINHKICMHCKIETKDLELACGALYSQMSLVMHCQQVNRLYSETVNLREPTSADPTGFPEDSRIFHLFYFQITKSLVNTNLFYTNFTNMHFQKFPIPHLTRTMKQKFHH